MAYIGNPPAERFTSFDYQDLTGGSGTSFTLTHPVGNAQEILVMVNNVVQEPGVAYTVSGTGLTMTGSIASTDDFYVVYRGKAIQTATHPSDRALTATDGTFTGDLTVDTDTLHVDAANNRVGINTTSPGSALEIEDNTDIDMNSSGTGHLQIDGNAYQFAIALNSSAANLYTNSGSRAIVFGTNETERARVTNNGITFNGDTAAANALNDYEEGTWTPTGATNSGTAATFGSVVGSYVKIGNLVTVNGEVKDVDTTGTTSTAQLRIAGLPFAPTSEDWVGSASVNTVSFQGSRTAIACQVSFVPDTIIFPVSGSGAARTNVDHGDITSGTSDFFFSVQYQTF